MNGMSEWRPWPFGSLDLTPEGLVIAPARVEAPYPNMLRAAQYPNGAVRIQGAYAWTQGSEGGVVWRDLPLVQVDEDGQEIREVPR